MKKGKNLLLLVLGITLVGCGGGDTSSEVSSEISSESQSSSEINSSVSSEEGVSNFDLFLETYDALGKNYYAFDAIGRFWGEEEYDVSCNVNVTTDKGTLNLATNSGIALADNGNSAYRFGIDLEAEEVDPSKMFLPSYHPANFYYYGFNTPEEVIFELNEEVFDFLYRIPTSEEVKALSDELYGQLGYSRLPTFKGMFTEGKDADGNVTFTTNNIVFAMNVLEYNSWGRIEGYSDIYNYNAYDEFESTIEDFGENGIETLVTMLEADGYYMLDFQVFLASFSKEYPYVERQLVPLSQLPDYEVESYDLVSYIVPEDFYANGPGAEPQESVEARAKLKAQLDNVLSNNYTLNFVGDSEMLQGATYTSKVYNDTCYTFIGEDFSYSYYYVPVDETQPDVAKGGIYYYGQQKGAEDEEVQILSTKDYLDYYISQLQTSGATYDVDGATLTYIIEGEKGSMNLSDYCKLIYSDNFGHAYYLSEEMSAAYEEVYDGKNYWEVMYGGDWIDQFYYNERTGRFVLSNYYIRYAFVGSNTLFFNYGEVISLDFLPGLDAEDSPIVDADIFWYGYTYAFGVFIYSDIGTTKADATFGAYVNENYGFNLPLEGSAE